MASVFQHKVFNDPIHGHIELHPLCVKIIDTPQFQRLRYIKQLGGCFFVFPGALHSRFEHSIGVCHLAGKLIKAIRERQPELNITDKDVLCVQIAGLCHDLGHGPFSHMFEYFLHQTRPAVEWKHEQASIQMFDHLLKENELMATFLQYGLEERDIVFIKEQIYSKRVNKQSWPYSGRSKEKAFLYEVVANRRNGIDVDKWDYFARDCYHLGIKLSFDHNRFMSFCRVISIDDEMQICNRDKEVANVYDMFHIRSVLHERAYQHKTTRIIEVMITEALKMADEHILIQGKDGKNYKLSECIDDMEAYTKLNDSIYQRILHSSEPQLSKARDLLHEIECRRLYKYIGQKLLTRQSQNVRIEDEIALSVKNKDGEPLVKPDDIICLTVTIDYGKGSENPVDNFRFYRKDNPDKAVLIKRQEVSPMLPMVFLYQYVIVYSRKLDEESTRNLSICFQKWLED